MTLCANAPGVPVPVTALLTAIAVQFVIDGLADAGFAVRNR